MRNAIRHGATREEILEVLQLTTVMGIHSCNMAIPILMEEIEARQWLSRSPSTFAPIFGSMPRSSCCG
jgi:hypothetical protein